MHQWCIILIYLHPFNISPLMPPFDHACCTSPPSLYRGECTLEFSRKVLPIATKIGLLFGPLCSNWILPTWMSFPLWHPSLSLFPPPVIYLVRQVTPPFHLCSEHPFSSSGSFGFVGNSWRYGRGLLCGGGQPFGVYLYPCSSNFSDPSPVRKLSPCYTFLALI